MSMFLCCVICGSDYKKSSQAIVTENLTIAYKLMINAKKGVTCSDCAVKLEQVK
jgi:hypothetical protein